MNLDFSPSELATWVKQAWNPAPPTGSITGISTDTRTLQPGNLYVALSGEHFDGHAFIDAAVKKGAIGTIIQHHFKTVPLPYLSVSDPLLALQQMATNYRKSWNGTAIGITGSVAKTTVKEMCKAVLSRSFCTHATKGNLNNHIGLPLTILSMPRSTTHALFEMGMNHPGEIDCLTKMAQPTIGIITTIGAAHIEYFNSVEDIAREKGDLLKSLPPNGLAILDAESRWFTLLKDTAPCRVASFSMGAPADYVGRIVDEQTIEVDHHLYRLPIPGKHMLHNALNAIVLGLESHISPEEIADGLLHFHLPPMRWEEIEIEGIRFINDAYNANPLSMRAALQTFAEQSCVGEKWVILGGMRELGKSAAQEHAQLGTFVKNLAFKRVVIIGELAHHFDPKNRYSFTHFSTPEKALPFLKKNLCVGDHVLLKASRGEHLEKITNLLMET